MPAESSKRKRPVASCSQCYQKKQKCDRQYPCTTCTKRRLPELCSYTFADHDERTATVAIPPPPPAHSGSAREDVASHASPLVSHLGYSEESKSNLFSLMRKFDLLGTAPCEAGSAERALRGAESQIRECLQVLPKRPILNCLVQHFFEEVNWISEMIHPPMFLNRYEQWWKAFPGSSVDSLEFGLLILRICALSAQFMPSQSHREDSILGIPVNTVRLHCRNLAMRLQRVTDDIRGVKSLVSVQHLFYWSCYLEDEGAITDAWYALGHAISVSQDIGLHLPESAGLTDSMDHVEKDMRRRCFWILFTWDRYFSLILGRRPWIQHQVSEVSLPKMRIFSGAPKARLDMPDAFTERLLEARLALLWSSALPTGPPKDAVYDVCAVEEFYEKICKTYIPDIPPQLALRNADTHWDSDAPMLPRQRQLLRISIYASTCQLFLPLLQLEEEQIANLPQYKKDILLCQRHRLVEGAVRLLDGVFALHHLLGRMPTALFILSYFSFHAAVVLSMHLIWTVSTRENHLSKLEEGQQALYGLRPALEGIEETPKHPRMEWRHRAYIDKALRLLYDFEGVSVVAKLAVSQLEKVTARLESIMPPEQVAPQRYCSLGGDMAASDGDPGAWLGFELTAEREDRHDIEISRVSGYPSTDPHSTPQPRALGSVSPATESMADPLSAYSDSSLDSAIGGSVLSDLDPIFSLPIRFEGALDHWHMLQQPALELAAPQLQMSHRNQYHRADSRQSQIEGSKEVGTRDGLQ